MPETSQRTENGIFFRKMHGLGNDFVVIDARKSPLAFNRSQFARIADRRFGVGCDQLIMLETSRNADARMRIFNPDGGEVQACGNATRCIGHLLADEAGRNEVSIETVAGILRARRSGDDIAVDMGFPVLDWAAIPLAGAARDTARIPLDLSAISPRLPHWFSAVNMGNPHGVFFVEDVDAIDLAIIGPALETHPIFPEKANISFAKIEMDGSIRLRVWERAAGATLACGTAACATFVAANRLGLATDQARIRLPGGTLTIRHSAEGRVIMIGPIAQSFTGFIAPDLLAEAA
ncbi:MAG: diaminopimelate epimerase [Rhizobiales bacterium]|nr:diaminopimelate epimerase [Hyphomicrobiales bacterium]